MRTQHTSLFSGRIQRKVFDALPPASRSGRGITVREISEHTGLSDSQIRGALRRLNRHQLAFCFGKDERNAGVWERTRSEPGGPPPT